MSGSLSRTWDGMVSPFGIERKSVLSQNGSTRKAPEHQTKERCENVGELVE
jgi:hypothetical protein